MSTKVKLNDIIEAIEMQFNESTTMLNSKTGKLVTVLNEFLRDAEDGEPYNHLIDWQQDEMKLAYDIIKNEEIYIELPDEFEINEYSMMEDFCFILDNTKVRDSLLHAIRGKGAFRRFKDKIYDFDISEKWYEYRKECYKQIAIEFCQRNELKYDE